MSGADIVPASSRNCDIGPLTATFGLLRTMSVTVEVTVPPTSDASSWKVAAPMSCAAGMPLKVRVPESREIHDGLPLIWYEMLDSGDSKVDGEKEYEYGRSM